MQSAGCAFDRQYLFKDRPADGADGITSYLENGVNSCLMKWICVADGKYEYFNDLYCFDPTNLTWTALLGLGDGDAPSPRVDMGLVAKPDGMLYVLGGLSTMIFGFKTQDFKLHCFNLANMTWTWLILSGVAPPQCPPANYRCSTYVLGFTASPDVIFYVVVLDGNHLQAVVCHWIVRCECHCHWVRNCFRCIVSLSILTSVWTSSKLAVAS
jgi:hypothetical protein